MEKKELTSEKIELINKWLPFNALTEREGARGNAKTSIASWSVTDRLNEVFGINGWDTDCDIVSIQDGMVLVKLVFSVPEYGIHHTTFGGNNNRDLGDAAKGAETDALTKVASWIGIGTGVWRGEYAHDKYVVDGVDLAKQKKAKGAKPTANAKVTAAPVSQPKATIKRQKNTSDIMMVTELFLRENQSAMEFYQKFLNKPFSDFTQQDMLTIYQHLDDNKRVVD